VARLRVAPVVGGGASSLFANVAAGRPPVVVRGAPAAVQVVHVDDVASALLTAIERTLSGVYNVAADGWLRPEEAAALHGRRRVPALPAPVAERVLQMTWATGLGDAPPSVLPYLEHPWVVANDRLKDAGWKPAHTNEEAILLATPPPAPSRVRWLGAAGAALSAAGAAAWWWSRARRRQPRLARRHSSHSGVK
jgi:nucleoside-diphosphate-sugar epimerase